MQDGTTSTRRVSLLSAVALGGFLLAACSGSSEAPKISSVRVEPTLKQARAQEGEQQHFNVLPTSVSWMAAPPASGLPPGVEFAPLEGHPSSEGPFTFRLRFHPGARLMPHTHPEDERITVISGSVHQGLGETFDQNATEEIPAGSFVYRSPGLAHFVWFDEVTVLQFHGTGPFGVDFVESANNP